MIARKIILGFGLALVLPMLIHYGIEIVRPAPDWKQYQVENYYERHKQASPEEQTRLEAEQQRLSEQQGAVRRRWSRAHFFGGIVLGLAMTLIGSCLRVSAVGSGLMLGGIFTFTEGCWWSWLDLPPIGRFLALLTAFIVLLRIGYQRPSEQRGPTPNPA